MIMSSRSAAVCIGNALIGDIRTGRDRSLARVLNGSNNVLRLNGTG